MEASEIMKAEQELMREGTPLEEVQKLINEYNKKVEDKLKEKQTELMTV